MFGYHHDALAALNKLIDQGCLHINCQDYAIFEKTPGEAEHHTKRLAEIYDAVFRGFFSCAAKGVTLYRENRVVERFGTSIEENYPEGTEPFLKFARTYWTLRVLVYDLMENDMDWIGAHLLAKLEQDIGPVFFPFPGPCKVAPSKRERLQRDLLEEIGKRIDVEEFMRGNPILIRDRESSLWRKLKKMFLGT